MPAEWRRECATLPRSMRAGGPDLTSPHPSANSGQLKQDSYNPHLKSEMWGTHFVPTQIWVNGYLTKC